MTDEHTTLVQARLTSQRVRQIDQDMATLGLRTRSEAVREGLRLLHKQAQQDALAREYDNFYGSHHTAPLTEMTTLGDQLAADAIYDRDSSE